jgi:dTDP-4-dehydrorhamnose reductase
MPITYRVLVLGANGMLGHMVQQVLSDSSAIEVHGTQLLSRSAPLFLDVMSGLEDLENIFNKCSGYDYLINCIGILPSQIANDDPTSIRKAIKINSIFPLEISAFCKERNAKVIHMSTDGVFSGASKCYYEEDVHDCTNVYGITKSLGEVCANNVINLRCSIIGPSPFLGGGLLEWFLRQPANAEIVGFTNQVWHGVSTYQFSKLCLAIIEGGHFGNLRNESSVFHFVPNEPITKHALLCLFGEVFNKSILINPNTSDDLTYSRILKTSYQGLRHVYPISMSPFEMVSELAAYMKIHELKSGRLKFERLGE